MNIRKMAAAALAAGMMLTATPVVAESVPVGAVVEDQKLNANYTLALNAINAEDYASAKQYLDICFVYCDPQSNPAMYADLLLKRACIDVMEGNNSVALLNLDAALNIDPELADAYLVRTQIYNAQGDFAQATENLEKYIDLTQDASLYETLAQLHEAGGNLDAAEAAYQQFVDATGANAEEAGFQKGLYRMQGGSFQEAIEAFQSYADDATYGAGAMYNIGVCRMNLGDYAGAVEAFTASRDKGGEFSGVYYNRGVCEMMTESWADAIADFEKSLESEPYVDDARYNLAISYLQKGDYAAANEAFTTLIKALEDAGKAPNPGAYYYRAICRDSLNDLNGAVADLTFCIDNGYELEQAHAQRAQIYHKLGDTEKEAEDLRDSTQTVQPAQSVQSVQSVQSIQSIQTVQPEETAQPVQSIQSVN